MRVRRLILPLAFVACLPPRPAQADFFLTPFVGLKFGASTNFPDPDVGADNTKFALGGAFSLLDERLLGLEAEFAYMPRFFDTGPGGLTTGGRVTTLTGNALLLTPPGWTRGGLRPYAVAGAGWLRIVNDVAENILPTDSNLWTMTLGGGAIGAVTDRSSLRFELRYFKNLTSDEIALTRDGEPGRLSFWRATVGVSVRLGER